MYRVTVLRWSTTAVFHLVNIDIVFYDLKSSCPSVFQFLAFY